MGRTTWVKPMTLVQQFEANEPVAAAQCYQIACRSSIKSEPWLWDWDKIKIGDPKAPTQGWEKREGNYSVRGKWMSFSAFYHKNCLDPTKNVFRVSADGSKIEYLNEIGGIADEGGVDFVDDNGDGIIGPGDTIYWWGQNNNATGSTRWNHWGTLESLDPGHPLRS